MQTKSLLLLDQASHPHETVLYHVLIQQVDHVLEALRVQELVLEHIV
jgi:hypothetical protein